ncbi:MAG: hypothetical protein AABX73_01730 [Nanoarchaeota archaeon]
MKKDKDKLTIAVYFSAGFIALNILEQSLTTHALGIAFLIAAVYGTVCIFKKKKFLFTSFKK